MKKILALVLACLLCLSVFAACSKSDDTETTAAPAASGETPSDAENNEPASGDGSLKAVLNAGKLIIATSPDFPPFENIDAEGNVTGIEIDILNKICEKLGVTLEIEQMDFDAILPGLSTGKYDLGVSGFTATEERKENALFTDPYCLAAISIVVPEGSSIAAKEDLAGKTVSCQTGTTAELYCQNNGLDFQSFAQNTDAQMALTTGKVDAWVIDDLTAKEMVDNYNGLNDQSLVILEEPLTTEPYGFVTKLGNESLINAINEQLAALLADGTIKALFEQYDAPYTAPDAA